MKREISIHNKAYKAMLTLSEYTKGRSCLNCIFCVFANKENPDSWYCANAHCMGFKESTKQEIKERRDELMGWKNLQPTYKQLNLIKEVEDDFGVKFTGQTRGEASEFIDKYMKQLKEENRKIRHD